MNSSIAAPRHGPARAWAITGFVFAGIYLLVSIYEFTTPSGHNAVASICAVIYVLVLLGSIFALIHEYSRARVLMLIGGILSFPLGILMLIAAGRMKVLALKARTDAVVAAVVPTAPSAQELKPMSFAARWLGICISPASTFRNIVRFPDALVALYLPALTGLLVAATQYLRVGAEQLARNAMALNPNARALPPEAVEYAIHSAAQTSWIGIVLAPVFRLLVPVLVAALAFLILNLLFKAHLDYKSNTMITAVGCYAFLPRVLGDVVAILAIRLSDPTRVNPGSIAPTNPGYFLNPMEVPRGLMALASSFDVFTIWSIVLLGIGFSAATEGKTKPFPIAGVFFGLWMHVVLAQVVLMMS